MILQFAIAKQSEKSWSPRNRISLKRFLENKICVITITEDIGIIIGHQIIHFYYILTNDRFKDKTMLSKYQEEGAL